jgi:hypothetical protein
MLPSNENAKNPLQETKEKNRHIHKNMSTEYALEVTMALMDLRWQIYSLGLSNYVIS